jgi:hypothetical protein
MWNRHPLRKRGALRSPKRERQLLAEERLCNAFAKAVARRHYRPAADIWRAFRRVLSVWSRSATAVLRLSGLANGPGGQYRPNNRRECNRRKVTSDHRRFADADSALAACVRARVRPRSWPVECGSPSVLVGDYLFCGGGTWVSHQSNLVEPRRGLGPGTSAFSATLMPK